MRDKLINPYTLVHLEVISEYTFHPGDHWNKKQKKKTTTTQRRFLFCLLNENTCSVFITHVSQSFSALSTLHMLLCMASFLILHCLRAKRSLFSSLCLHGLLSGCLLANSGVRRKLRSCPEPLLAGGWWGSNSPVNVGRRWGSHRGNGTGTDTLWGSEMGEHGQSIWEVGGRCWGVGRCAHLVELNETWN